MGRGTLWAASSGPSSEASDDTLNQIASDLGVSAPAPHSSSSLFRAMRTMLNVTQKEFGALVSPEGAAPISASVVCQLECGAQDIPASILERAASATAAVHSFADWRRDEQAGCFDSRLSALRALGAESEALFALYLGSGAVLTTTHAALVEQYLGLVSKRKQSTAGNRPATRGPYKKKPSAKGLDSSSSSASSTASSTPSSALSNASTSRAASPVPSVESATKRGVGPRGPYKTKRRPVAVPLEGSSPSSMASSDLSSPQSGGSELQTLKECLLEGQAILTPRTADALDFLTKLEAAERRDEEALATGAQEKEALHRLRTQCGISADGRSPRDSPRGDYKRRATRPITPGGGTICVTDLDQLDLADFTLDELIASQQQEGCLADEPLQAEPLHSVDDIMELVCKQMESPRWSDFGDSAMLAECMC